MRNIFATPFFSARSAGTHARIYLSIFNSIVELFDIHTQLHELAEICLLKTSIDCSLYDNKYMIVKKNKQKNKKKQQQQAHNCAGSWSVLWMNNNKDCTYI